MDPNDQLKGSPYLIATDSSTLERFEAAHQMAQATRTVAVGATRSLHKKAADLLQPYARATRSELVTESNKIEGYVWDPDEVRAAVEEHLPLFEESEFALTQVVQSDKKLYEVLGLYKAHELADSWDDADGTPRAMHIRQFHRLILGGVEESGAYKLYPNQISGREDELQTALPIDVPRAINELSDWWVTTTAEPLLTATVVHAWLAHIHPFSDGNGRLARVLANLELRRHSYAPLILSSQSDRGEYYVALQESDDGNILPLYELFEKVVRRQALLMKDDNYVSAVLNRSLLRDQQQRFNVWSSGLAAFAAELESAMSRRGWSLKREGELGLKAFSLLWTRSEYGNGWFVTAAPKGRSPEWLLWFGYKTDEWTSWESSSEYFPSIHISRRDLRGPHPYRWDYPSFDGSENVPDELRLVPLRKNAMQVRFDREVIEFSLEEAADELAAALVRVRA